MNEWKLEFDSYSPSLCPRPRPRPTLTFLSAKGLGPAMDLSTTLKASCSSLGTKVAVIMAAAVQQIMERVLTTWDYLGVGVGMGVGVGVVQWRAERMRSSVALILRVEGSTVAGPREGVITISAVAALAAAAFLT